MSLWMIEMDRQGVSTAGLHKIGQQCIPVLRGVFRRRGADGRGSRRHAGRGFYDGHEEFRGGACSAGLPEQLGLAQAAMEDAVTYANQRIAFNKPIANFQMTQEKLTEMEIRLQNVCCTKRCGSSTTTFQCNSTLPC